MTLEIAIRHKILAGGPVNCKGCGKKIFVFFDVFKADTSWTLQFIADSIDAFYNDDSVYKGIFCTKCVKEQGFNASLLTRFLKLPEKEVI